jgi:YedE family putative selenium metabolism protein
VKKPKDFLASRKGIIIVGLVLGGLAASLQALGNPPNMGICVACFTRDIAGALGLHRAGIVQYLRPEIPAFCLGAFIAALAFREFRPRTGSAPVVRFMLGMFAMIGALVFLGCPWRAMLRLVGGDWNAIVGIIGLIVGITVGVQFLKMGFSLGRSHPTRNVAGLALPFVMLVLLLLVVFKHPQFGENAALFRSAKGPGAASAPVVISIIVGLIVGFLAQRTRFCTVGGLRDVILMRDFHLVSGLAAFVVAAFVMNLIYGQFHPGFEGQPAAHTKHWLNLGGMALAGLSFTLAGGCPGRQIFLSGEGDGDSAMFVFGMLVGAGIAHNFLMVATQRLAPYIVVIGLIVVCIIGIMGREKLAPAR